ncbi:unnamed protein product [Medioppia subpectinata]|uniref:Uncharacterized protein n=1 Tax=Medioppia subpectinata TaxID=1979941 RepID=A0A7R9KPA0_9ACAR|nr:unnamed protein product [Medioppia subpectinata]CAG2107301.1 unnamed protein product [Medioppia subpectinata]
MQGFCQKIFYAIMGFSAHHMDYVYNWLISDYHPIGVRHVGGHLFATQLITKRPTKFDFRESGNIVRYGQPVPPEYDLSTINSTNIALIYAANDWLNDIKDIAYLRVHLKYPTRRGITWS